MTFYQVFGLQFEDLHSAINFGIGAAGDDETFTVEEVIRAADGRWEVIDTVLIFDKGGLDKGEEIDYNNT